MAISKKLAFFVSALLLSGCGGPSASSTGVFTAEGKRGFVVNCSGVERNWGMCYKKAGDICEERGYEIVEVTGEAGTVTSVKSGTGLSSATTTTTHNRIMVLQCRRPEGAQAENYDREIPNLNPVSQIYAPPVQVQPQYAPVQNYTPPPQQQYESLSPSAGGAVQVSPVAPISPVMTVQPQSQAIEPPPSNIPQSVTVAPAYVPAPANR